MRRFPWTIALVLPLAAFYTACGGGGGASRTTAATASAGSPEPPRGEASSGGEAGGGASSSLNTARFRTLAVAVSPPTGGTVSDNHGARRSAVQGCTSCRERYRQDTDVVLTAAAAPGFVFVRWEGGACDRSTSVTCSLTLDRDTQVTARFK